MNTVKWILLVALTSLATLNGCSIYQSEGRACVEDGCSAFVGNNAMVANIERESLRYCSQANKNNNPLKIEDLYQILDFSVPNTKAYIQSDMEKTKLLVLGFDSNHEPAYLCQFSYSDIYQLESELDHQLKRAHSYLTFLMHE